ncbi:MAG TPA: Ig-like domain-containing protein [Humisphaera sp.]
MSDRRHDRRPARRPSARPAPRAAVEPLEGRQLMAATPWPVVTGFAVEGTAIARTGTPILRSRVSTIAIAFDRDMSSGLDGGDLSLLNLNTGRKFRGDDVTFAYDPATFIGTWTFDGAAGTVGASLPDGRYVAILSATGASVGQPAVLDGDGNGTAGGTLTFAFGRFFGDANGTGTVDAADKTAFAAALTAGGPDARFDYDNNGVVDGADQVAFNARFGTTLAAVKPAVPTGLVGVPLPGGQINLGWSAGPGDWTAVRLERATVSTGPFTTLGFFSAGATNYLDTGRTAGVKYYYRLTALSPWGSSAASAAVGVTASASPKISTSVGTLNFADGVDGLTSAPKGVKVTNTGTGGLVIRASDVTVTGTGAAEFTVGGPTFPLVIGPGQSATLQVRMNAAGIGTMPTATLRIASNDAGKVVKTVALRGLGFDVTTRGPSLQQMLDYNNVRMTVVRPDGNVGATAANERAIPLLAKAGSGPVTFQLIGVGAQGVGSAEVMKLGWYVPAADGTAPTALTPAFAVPGIDNISVSPGFTGSTSFDPGGQTFGLYADWPGKAGARSYTEDALNAFDPQPWTKRKFRFYPLLAADGSTVDNAFLVTAELNTGTYFTRTVAMIVRNVRHAAQPTGWRSQDVGPAVGPGQAVSVGGVYTVVGGAANPPAPVDPDAPPPTDPPPPVADAMHFAHRSLTGNGTVTVRLTSIGTSNPAAAAGLTFRASVDPLAPFAGIVIGADGSAAFASRSVAGAAADASVVAPVGPGAGTPTWLRVVRAGNVVTGYWSTDGLNWTQQGSATIPLPPVALVGMSVSSGDPAAVVPATFTNLKVVAGSAAVPTRVAAPAKATGVVTISAIAGEGATSARLVVAGAYVGGTTFGDGPYTFTWDSRTVVDGTYNVGVETTDSAGVKQRVTVSVVVANPKLAPEVWLPTLGNGDVLSGTVNLAATATDERGVAGVTFSVDGVAVAATDTTFPYAVSWNSARVTNGWHTITVVARDVSGLSTTSVPVKVRVANGAAPTSPEITSVTVGVRRSELVPWTTSPGQVIPRNLRLAGSDSPRSAWGGDATRNVGGTGFFRVQKVNNRWWLVDPDGYLYFDNSVVAVEPQVQANNKAAFESKFGPVGPAATEAWAAWVKNWLADLGIYSAAWATTPTLRTTASPMNYSLVLQLMSGFAKQIGSARAGTGNSTYVNGTMPVFDPRFADYCNAYFTDVFPAKYPGLDPKSDPYLLGYMTDNELPWSTSTLDNYLLLPPDDPNRAAAEAWLRNRSVSVPTDADRTDFLSFVAETYFRTTSRAIDAYDPNHLNLGARFLGGDGQKAYLYKAAKPYVDVATINYYDGLSPGSSLTKAQGGADMPFMVSEFYAKGVDSGLANRAGFGYTVRTQADRGAYYQSVALSMLASRNAVGVSWLSLMDNNDANAFADPSNSDANKGLMPITYPLTQADNPYRPLTDRIKDVNVNLFELIKRLTP